MGVDDMTLTKDMDVSRTADPMLPRPFKVIAKRAETHDTITLDFEAADGGAPISFTPGQFTMVYIHGVGEIPLSISGNPNRPEILIHTVRAVGGVTNAIFALEPGDVAGIRGPFGTGWPAAIGKDLIIVAGGIGLAPVRPVIYQALANRDQHVCLGLAYGARTPNEVLYRDELREWNDRSDIRIEVTVDRSDRGWRGSVGVVTPLVQRLRCSSEETVAVICGPEVMMKIVARALEDRGVPQEDIYVSLERNMKCGVGFCGHCQFGSDFICKDGPVVPYMAVAERLGIGSI
jgi:NAD(P)H-flavin reductase